MQMLQSGKRTLPGSGGEFPPGIRKVEEKAPAVNRKAAILSPEIFSDNFSDKMGLYPDNYPQALRG